MQRTVLIFSLAFLLGTSLSAHGQKDAGLGLGETGTGEAEILTEEVVAPEIDWRSEEWVPLYMYHEDPKSVECGGRAACESDMAEALSE